MREFLGFFPIWIRRRFTPVTQGPFQPQPLWLTTGTGTSE